MEQSRNQLEITIIIQANGNGLNYSKVQKMEGKIHIQRLAEQEEGVKEEASVPHWIKPVGGNTINGVRMPSMRWARGRGRDCGGGWGAE